MRLRGRRRRTCATVASSTAVVATQTAVYSSNCTTAHTHARLRLVHGCKVGSKKPRFKNLGLKTFKKLIITVTSRRRRCAHTGRQTGRKKFDEHIISAVHHVHVAEIINKYINNTGVFDGTVVVVVVVSSCR